MNPHPWSISLPNSLRATPRRPDKFVRTLCLLGFLALASLSCLSRASAQVSASIKGIVTDASGSPVPAAEVKTKNLETGAARNSFTDDAGRYLVLALQVGEYKVSVSKSGFQDAI